MKKIIYSILGLLLVSALSVGAATVYQGFQGGTGTGTATTTDVGKYLRVASSSPWLTYEFASISIPTTTITINGVSTSTFVFASSTTGTDFTISTSTDTITFNLPTASSTSRGLLSTSDWTTFNNKQDALSSGTNIKTVGGVSLLGAGDVGVIGTNYGGTGTTTALGSMAFQNSNVVSITGGNATLTNATSTKLYVNSGGLRVAGVATFTSDVYITPTSTILATDGTGKIVATTTSSGGLTLLYSTSTIATVTDFTTPTFAAYNNLRLRFDSPAYTGSDKAMIQINGDTGNNYAWGGSEGGTAVAGAGPAPEMALQGNDTAQALFTFCDISNFSGSAKRMSCLGGRIASALAAPTDVESIGLNSTTTQITSIRFKLAGANSIATGTVVTIYGY